MHSKKYEGKLRASVVLYVYLTPEIGRALDKLVKRRQGATPERTIRKSEVIRELIMAHANDA